MSLDKEKLHKLVDGIDEDKYRRYTVNKGDLACTLDYLQKEKSLEERLQEAGCIRDSQILGSNEFITYQLFPEDAIIRKYPVKSSRNCDRLYCPLDFDEIMATIKYLEGRG